MVRVHSWELIPTSVWKAIWNIRTTPKIQRFLWRACAAGLATGDAFQRRNIRLDPICVRCGDLETRVHFLFGCTFSRIVWFGSNIGCNFSTSPHFTIGDWISSWRSLSHLGKKESRSKITHMSFLCWYLWVSRNDCVIGRRLWKPEEVIMAANSAFKEFMATKSIASDAFVVHTAVQQQWQPPEASYIKCNCDASLMLDQHRVVLVMCGGILLVRFFVQCLLHWSLQIFYWERCWLYIYVYWICNPLAI
ncbi:uncharacterized protein LOC122649741 [Telopea speciosissima]|uniref:uncharacterized protein LOC122649741 n=1 Tax=Telopea speciosissima TaxID=54955 RepID=UPI001CC38011|nr:uncharacterized protein LOC122649741 [Telopea speciosissima]